jgi:hypothetical protein
MRILSAISLTLVLLGISIFAGCSRQKTIVVPGMGKTTVREGAAGQPKQVTIENKDTKVEINTEAAVSKADLGMPIYPGAEVGQSMAMTQNTDKEGGTVKQVSLTTSDAVDKVKAFYLKQYPKAGSMDMNSPEVSMTHLTIQEGKEQKLIIISRKANEDKTQIILHFSAQK